MKEWRHISKHSNIRGYRFKNLKSRVLIFCRQENPLIFFNLKDRERFSQNS